MSETDLDEGERALVTAAIGAMGNAYAPYSHFRVGAALRMTDGAILTGSNFENASYGLSLCAETVAIAAANAQGRLRDIAAIAVAGWHEVNGDAGVITPCGRCRQIINEAQDLCRKERDIKIICANSDGTQFERHDIGSLLPGAFGPAQLLPSS